MHWQILLLHKRKNLIVLKQMRCPFCIVSQYYWTLRAAHCGRRLLLAGTIQGQKRTLLPQRGSIGLISRVQNSSVIFTARLSLSLFFCPVFFEIWSMTWNKSPHKNSWEMTRSQGQIFTLRLHNIRGDPGAKRSGARLASGYRGSTGQRQTQNNASSLWALGKKTSKHKQTSLITKQTRQSRSGSWSPSPLRSRPCDQESAGSWKVGVVSVMTENKSDPEGEKAEVKGVGKIIPEINCRRAEWERLLFVWSCPFKNLQLNSFFLSAWHKDGCF